MLGTNLGDLFPDILKLGSSVSLLAQTVIFFVIILVEHKTRNGSEAVYWLALLTVRAAATNIADLSVERAHLGYIPISGGLAALLAALVSLRRRTAPKYSTGDLPATDGLYWFTMLTAGALGTVIGDGVGHAFSSVQISVPISAVTATVALVLIFSIRARMAAAPAASYWIAVAAVRWWGTNVGDILAFLLTLPVSIVATGAVLTFILCFWREPLTRCGVAAPT
ncbi:hypothetical protein [Bradyrhizobium genosp. P]|uniref:hypothetical protein n=1 Tax=Bradyrhizobium genosp. P TaxID=83641 RepID=UPI003CF9A332